MSGLSLNVGLFSGIDYVALTEQLIQLDSISKNNLADRTKRLEMEYDALTAMMGRFYTTSYMIKNLNRLQPYLRTDVTSSNTNLMTVIKSGATNPVAGSYTFTPLQMASSQQTVARGVASDSEALGKTGTITIGKGWSVENQNSINLNDLNGGLGVTKGSFRLTDSSGARATIDIRKAVTIADVLDAINNNDNIDIVAELDGDHIVLRDYSRGSGTMSVQEVSGGSTAASLGLLDLTASTDAKGNGVMAGNSIWYLGENTGLNLLNDGNGLVFDSILEDLSIRCKDGTSVTIDFNKLSTSAEVEAGAPTNRKELTIGDVINTINNDGKGKVTARISDDGKGLTIEDHTTGNYLTTISQYSPNNPSIMRLFGLSSYDDTPSKPALADMFSDYRNGAPAKMTVTDADGHTADIELTSTDFSLIQAIGGGTMTGTADRINAKLSAAGLAVQVQVNNNYDGFVIVDTSGNPTPAGPITFKDYNDPANGAAKSDLASRLGLTSMENTDLLTSLQGVKTPETIRFTDKDGNWVDIEVTQADLDAAKSSNDNDATLAALIDLFNNKIADASAEVAGSLFAVEPGKITFTDTDGDSVEIEILQSDIDGLSSRQEIANLLNSKITDAVAAERIASGNNDFSVGIVFAVNANGSVVLTDTAGGTGPIVVESEAATNGNSLANFLGIEGEFEDANQVVGRGILSMEFDPNASVGIDVRLNSTGDGMLIVDTTGGSAPYFSVNRQGVAPGDVMDSLTYRLGINLNSASNEIQGRSFESLYNSDKVQNGTITTRNLIGGLDTVLVSTLNGGYGLNGAKPGTIEVQDRSGKSALITISQEEINSMQTLSDSVKIFNAKLAEAGVGITVRINDQKTGLEVVDTTGQSTHNLIFKDKVGTVTIPATPAIPGTDAVSGVITNGNTAHSSGGVTGGGTANLYFAGDYTHLVNGFTFAFTTNSANAGFDDTSKTFTFYLDSAVDNTDAEVAGAINVQLSAAWSTIYDPAIYGTMPGPPIVSASSGLASRAYADAVSGGTTSVQSGIGMLGSTGGDAKAILEFEKTDQMNGFMFAFTTNPLQAGFNSAAGDTLFIHLDENVFTETDPDVQDALVKAAIDAAIAAMPAHAFKGTGEIPTVKLVAGMGANAVYDAIHGGKTGIGPGLGVEGVTHVPEVPASTIPYDGKVASAFGLNVDSTNARVSGTSLNRQIISHNTLLSDLNGGAGVNMIGAEIIIRDSAGNTTPPLKIDASEVKTVGDLIGLVNRQSNLRIMAKINETGDGIVFEDFADGTGALTIMDANSSSKFVESLGIETMKSEKDEDGRIRITKSETHRIEVEATDSLDDIRKKINDLNASYTATILVDGSSAPYRLSLSSKHTGTAGAFNVDLSAIGLTTETMSEAKDAKIVYGDASISNGLVLSSSTNTFKGVINGADLTITGVSDTPVTITAASSPTDILVSLRSFIENYNTFREQLNIDMYFEVSDTAGIQANSILWNSPIAKSFDSEVTKMLQKTVTGIPGIYSLAALGITMSSNSYDPVSGTYDPTTTTVTGKLYFDEDKFMEVWERDPEGVQKFFFNERETTDANGNTIKVNTGWAQQFSDMADNLIGSNDGTIPGKVQSRLDVLDDSIYRNEQRIAFMEERLEFKRQMYLKQFYAMEQSLAKMTSQSNAVGNIMTSWQSNYSSGG